MDDYAAIISAEKIYATMISISRGDSAAIDEESLSISEETVEEIINASYILKRYILENIKWRDETFGR